MYEAGRAYRQDRGFTVAELVISVAVLLFVMTGVLGAIGFATTSTAAADRRVRATELANEQIELIRNLPYDSVGTAGGSPPGVVTSPATSGPYTIETTIRYSSQTVLYMSPLKTVTVRVSWSTPVAGSVSMQTDVAGKSDTGLYNFGDVKVNVTNEAGQPVQGVKIDLTGFDNRLRSVITTAGGGAYFSYVPAGTIALLATKTGYVCDAFTGSPQAIAQSLQTYATVARQVTSGKFTVTCGGLPVSGASVKLTGPTATQQLTTDALGVVEFQGLIAGSYTAAVTGTTRYNAGSGTMTTSLTVPNEKTVTVAPMPSTMKVTVTNSSGTLQKGVGVWVWKPGQTAPYFATALTNSTTGIASFTITNPNLNDATFYVTTANAYPTGTPTPRVLGTGLTLSFTVVK